MANSKDIIRLTGGQATANDDLAVFGAILSTGVVQNPPESSVGTLTLSGTWSNTSFSGSFDFPPRPLATLTIKVSSGRGVIQGRDFFINTNELSIVFDNPLQGATGLSSRSGYWSGTNRGSTKPIYVYLGLNSNKTKVELSALFTKKDLSNDDSFIFLGSLKADTSYTRPYYGETWRYDSASLGTPIATANANRFSYTFSNVPGVPGKDGIDGKVIEITENSTPKYKKDYIYRYKNEYKFALVDGTFSESDWNNATKFATTKGEPGANGLNGLNGKDGTNGGIGPKGDKGDTPKIAFKVIKTNDSTSSIDGGTLDNTTQITTYTISLGQDVKGDIGQVRTVAPSVLTPQSKAYKINGLYIYNNEIKLSIASGLDGIADWNDLTKFKEISGSGNVDLSSINTKISNLEAKTANIANINGETIISKAARFTGQIKKGHGNQGTEHDILNRKETQKEIKNEIKTISIPSPYDDTKLRADIAAKEKLVDSKKGWVKPQKVYDFTDLGIDNDQMSANYGNDNSAGIYGVLNNIIAALKKPGIWDKVKHQSGVSGLDAFIVEGTYGGGNFIFNTAIKNSTDFNNKLLHRAQDTANVKIAFLNDADDGARVYIIEKLADGNWDNNTVWKQTKSDSTGNWAANWTKVSTDLFVNSEADYYLDGNSAKVMVDGNLNPLKNVIGGSGLKCKLLKTISYKDSERLVSNLNIPIANNDFIFIITKANFYGYTSSTPITKVDTSERTVRLGSHYDFHLNNDKTAFESLNSFGYTIIRVARIVEIYKII